FKFSKSREYENIKRISVKRNTLGEVYFILTCNTTSEKSFERVGESTIGIDFGLKTYLTCSNGTEIASPQFFKSNLKKIKKANKSISRKKKNSKRRKKALRHLQRVHRDVTNKRTDFHWKLAHTLCKENRFIAIEDLDIESMKKRWGRKISDLAFSSFIPKLEQISL